MSEAHEFIRMASAELEKLVSSLQTQQLHEILELRYLQGLVNGPLRAEIGADIAQDDGDSKRFFFKQSAGVFYFSDQFAVQWFRMKTDLNLSDKQLLLAIRIFFLHEMFHVSQGLTSYRHHDSNEAKACVISLDYYADFSAAIASYYLYAGNGNDWYVFADQIEGVLYAMAVFDHPLKGGLLSYSRFRRYFLAHYQYHRIFQFRGKKAKQLQLLFHPAIDLYGLERTATVNDIVLRNSWAGQTTLWLVSPDEDGLPMLYRFKPQRVTTLEKLSTGIFSVSLQSTSPFFSELFDSYPNLVGGRTGDSPGAYITRHLDDEQRGST